MQYHTVSANHLRARGPLVALTQNSTPNRASIISSSGGRVRLVPASDTATASQQRHPHADHSQCRLDPASTTSPERSEDMHPSRPCLYRLCPRLALLLSQMLIAGLASCGPASSDNAPVLESRANVAG
jgi:hypothetical protein